MRKYALGVAGVLGGLMLSGSVLASTILGSQLLGVATFPNQQPQVTGTSLFFGAANSSAFEKLMTFPVTQYIHNDELDITFNLTRLDCAPNTCGNDFNPIFGLSDGNKIVILSIGEDFNGAIGASAMPDLGAYAGYFYYASTLASGYGFPAAGGQISFRVKYQLGSANTVTEGWIDGVNVSYTHPIALNPAHLSLVLVHDNDRGEQYQIDSLDIVSPETPVAVDIKPGSCPNPLNTIGNGVVSVAISNSNGVNVADIDPATVRLAGVAALRWSREDAATPYQPYTNKAQDRFVCTAAGADGVTDLVFKFDKDALVGALGGGSLSDSQVVKVPLTGKLRNGNAIVGEDVMWIRAGK